MEVAITLAGIIVAAVVIVVLAIRSLIIICPPNRVAVISGRSRDDGEGTARGYRILRGGRTIRIPLLEKVDWMDLNTIAIDADIIHFQTRRANGQDVTNRGPDITNYFLVRRVD